MIIYVNFNSRRILTEAEFQKEMEHKADDALSFEDYLRDNWELEKIARTDFDELWCAYQTYLGRFLEEYVADDFVCVDLPDNCELIYVDWDSEELYTEREYLATREARFLEMFEDNEELEYYLEDRFSLTEIARASWEDLKNGWRNHCTRLVKEKFDLVAYALK